MDAGDPVPMTRTDRAASNGDAAPQGDNAAVVSQDAPCLDCGYNLRGLAPAGRCPECGDPIERTISGTNLRGAPLGWLLRVRRGCRLLIATVVGAPLALLVILVASVIVSAAESGGGAAAFAAAGAVYLLGGGYVAMPLVGLWLVASPDPRPFVARRSRAGAVLRAAVALNATWWVVVAIDRSWGMSWPVSLWAYALLSPFGVAGIAGFLAYIFLNEQLMRRGGNASMANFSRMMLRWLVGSAIVALASLVAEKMSWGEQVFLPLGAFAGLAAVVLLVVLVLLNPFVAHDVLNAAVQARRTIAHSAPGPRAQGP